MSAGPKSLTGTIPDADAGADAGADTDTDTDTGGINPLEKGSNPFS